MPSLHSFPAASTVACSFDRGPHRSAQRKTQQQQRQKLTGVELVGRLEADDQRQPRVVQEVPGDGGHGEEWKGKESNRNAPQHEPDVGAGLLARAFRREVRAEPSKAAGQPVGQCLIVVGIIHMYPAKGVIVVRCARHTGRRTFRKGTWP